MLKIMMITCKWDFWSKVLMMSILIFFKKTITQSMIKTKSKANTKNLSLKKTMNRAMIKNLALNKAEKKATFKSLAMKKTENQALIKSPALKKTENHFMIKNVIMRRKFRKVQCIVPNLKIVVICVWSTFFIWSKIVINYLMKYFLEKTKKKIWVKIFAVMRNLTKFRKSFYLKKIKSKILFWKKQQKKLLMIVQANLILMMKK
jgi:hypothetical protein